MHFWSGESSTLGGDDGGDGESESDEEESSDLPLPPSCSDNISLFIRSFGFYVILVFDYETFNTYCTMLLFYLFKSYLHTSNQSG